MKKRNVPIFSLGPPPLRRPFRPLPGRPARGPRRRPLERRRLRRDLHGVPDLRLHQHGGGHHQGDGRGRQPGHGHPGHPRRPDGLRLHERPLPRQGQEGGPDGRGHRPGQGGPDPSARRSATGPGRRAATSSGAPSTKASLREKIELVREAYDAAQSFDPRIVKVKAHHSDSLVHVCIANSEGLLVRDTRPMVKLVCVGHLREGRQARVGLLGRRRAGRPGVLPRRPDAAARSAGRRPARPSSCSRPSTPRPARCPSSSPRATAASSSTRPSATCSKPISTARRPRSSGTRWASASAPTLVTIYDDPTIPSFRGSYNVDDEGTPPRKNPAHREGRRPRAAPGQALGAADGRRAADRPRPAPGLQPLAHPADGQHLHRGGRRRARGHPALGQEGLLCRQPLGRSGRGLGQVHLLREPRLPHRGRQAHGPGQAGDPHRHEHRHPEEDRQGRRATSPSASRPGPAARTARTSRSTTAARRSGSRR